MELDVFGLGLADVGRLNANSIHVVRIGHLFKWVGKQKIQIKKNGGMSFIRLWVEKK